MFTWSWTCFLIVILRLSVKVLCDESNSIEQTEDVSRANKIIEKITSVVSLKQKSFFGRDFSHFCTGSILNQEWILTAGHCFTDKGGIPKEYLAVDVGSLYLTNENGTRYPISEYYIHPNESESIEIYKHDLCLVKLKRPIDLSGNVHPVRFGTIKDQEELPVVAGGWGRVSQHGHLNKKLRYVTFKTLRHSECQRLHENRHNIVDKEMHICGFGGPGKTLCFGDSGGPMFDVHTGNQVAVFSALEDCSGTYPVLFMKIEKYLDWINEVTKLNLTMHKDNSNLVSTI